MFLSAYHFDGDPHRGEVHHAVAGKSVTR